MVTTRAHRAVKQIARRAGERLGIADHHRRAVAGDLDLCRRACATLGHQRLSQLGEIHRFGAQGLTAAETINAGQARTFDADIQSGSIDPKQLIRDGVVTASR